jgi:hypothetical protein
MSIESILLKKESHKNGAFYTIFSENSLVCMLAFCHLPRHQANAIHVCVIFTKIEIAAEMWSKACYSHFTVR